MAENNYWVEIMFQLLDSVREGSIF